MCKPENNFQPDKYVKANNEINNCTLVQYRQESVNLLVASGTYENQADIDDVGRLLVVSVEG